MLPIGTRVHVYVGWGKIIKILPYNFGQNYNYVVEFEDGSNGTFPDNQCLLE